MSTEQYIVIWQRSQFANFGEMKCNSLAKRWHNRVDVSYKKSQLISHFVNINTYKINTKEEDINPVSC